MLSLSSTKAGQSNARNSFFSIIVVGSAAAVALSFAAVIGDLLWHGLSQVSLRFLIEPPTNAGRSGGISSILISTLLIVGIALAVTLPLGLGSAIWLSEYARKKGLLSRTARMVRLSLDVLAGVPSIVFGLFGNAFFSIFLGFGFSILAGGLTLAAMMLPIFIRTTEFGLSSLPDGWRASGAALGLSRATLIWNVLLPAASPAIAAGLILSIGRATAETAALIFTSGYVDRMPTSLLDSGRSLAVHIFDLSMNVTGGDSAAYGSAIVLVFVIAVVNTVAMALSDHWFSKKVTLQ
jgi:phosphate transport system permease protein